MVRNRFLQAIENEDISIFKKYPHHSFWEKWKSKKSNNKKGCLDYAINRSSDMGWIDLFMNMGMKPHENFFSLSMDRLPKDTVRVFKTLDKYNIFKNDELEVMIQNASQRGNFAIFELALKKGVKRIFDVENQLMKRKKLYLENGTIEHDKALDIIWSYWGVPDENTFREISNNVAENPLKRRTMTRSQKKGYDKINSIWNYKHPKWNEDDSCKLFFLYWSDGVIEKIKEDVECGWKLPYEKIRNENKKIKLQSKHYLLDYQRQVNEAIENIEVLLSQIEMRDKLKNKTFKIKSKKM